MKTIQELKKEEWNDRKLFNLSAEDSYMINPFPYDPWLPSNVINDFSIEDRRDYLYKGTLPWPEELRPDRFTIDNEGEWIIKEKANKECTKVYTNLTLHYTTTNKKVLEYDYNYSKTRLWSTLHPDFCAQLGIIRLENLHKIIERLKFWRLYFKKPIIIEYPIKHNNLTEEVGSALIDVKLGKKNYYRFRQFLLDLGNLGIAVSYDYDEIRYIFGNTSISVYI